MQSNIVVQSLSTIPEEVILYQNEPILNPIGAYRPGPSVEACVNLGLDVWLIIAKYKLR